MTRPRKITYVSGTRADFGLMRSTLQLLASHPGVDLNVLVTGMHLSEVHGLTVKEIREAGLIVLDEVSVDLLPETGETMSLAMAGMIEGFTSALIRQRPDVLLLLGDRGEMLAGAIVALNLNIPVVHLHGGERSGTIDESIRHAVSKLSHLHLVATTGSRERLIRMGERPDSIIHTGAPGLDGLAVLPSVDRVSFCHAHAFNPIDPIALVVFHPVVQEQSQAASQAHCIAKALGELDLQAVVLLPNSDAGAGDIRAVWESLRGQRRYALFHHLQRDEFVSVMSWADVMLGNSSAGIIEAATFGTPVINIGTRQNLRERNANVTDLSAQALLNHELPSLISAVLKQGRYTSLNCYGDGNAGPRILAALLEIPLGAALLEKSNAH